MVFFYKYIKNQPIMVIFISLYNGDFLAIFQKYYQKSKHFYQKTPLYHYFKKLN